MDWRLPEAKQRLLELIDAATKEPHETLSDDFAEFRKICEEENYKLEISPRIDRANPFLAEML